MTLTLLSLPGLQPDFFPALATEPLSVCAMIANRYNPFSYMAAFSSCERQKSVRSAVSLTMKRNREKCLSRFFRPWTVTAVTNQSHRDLLVRLSHQPQKGGKVVILVENISPTIPPIEDVINVTTLRSSRCSGH